MKTDRPFHEYGKTLIDFLYPNLCLGCGSYLENQKEVICESCDNKIERTGFPICGICGSPLENSDKCPACSAEHIFPIYSLGEYVDPLREIIHQFKFQHIRRASVSLGRRIVKLHGDRLRAAAPDLLVPVPLYSVRLKKRGFNQAADLVSELSRALDIPYENNAVEKVRRTTDQVRLNADSRRKNLRGVFAANHEKVKKRKIMIVDDVLTTGATVREVAETIRKAGGIPVAGIVVAFTGR